ncbi:hypothetical protein A3J33_00795 [candidate division WWE3 bacterium RIFCSPLOWO2_02_FULL_53_10]|uniref:Uncharacterized protein n=1 Tax=candidate division WWE3 bacterium RIFCSPLOWO2_02_FULL_53_10 TaxID=1802629 RepID=A0A1F4WNI0_UNCKA|nr:MAG: hypothetical protein A3J33_00795 [candidate division WWE3 bacterium RIFCSPLOWO2_02_FULL_53_10]
MAKSRKELVKKWIFWFLATVTTFVLFLATIVIFQVLQPQGTIDVFGGFVVLLPALGSFFISAYALLIFTARLLLPLSIKERRSK